MSHKSCDAVVFLALAVQFIVHGRLAVGLLRLFIHGHVLSRFGTFHGYVLGLQ